MLLEDINNVDKLKIEGYKRLLEEYNNKFNLTAIKPEEYNTKHFEDSLVGLSVINNGNVLDVGSGAGFPGMVLAIVNNNLKVDLLEATTKRCTFLNVVKEELNVENCNVINARAEDFAKTNARESYNFVTARAVARLNTLLEYCMPFVKVNGYFVAYKSNVTEELNQAKNAINILGGELQEVKTFTIGGENRCLVVIKKVKPTPLKYPRGNGKEKKNPL